MKETWRWYGPDDPVTLADAAQAGAKGIVTALHHVPPGDVWTADEIERRKAEVARLPTGAKSGLTWDVVESVFVSEDIKSRTGDWKAHIAAYKDSLRNLGQAGLRIVAYHFMPVLDWTRTDLAFPRPGGGTALRLDLAALAAFDLFLLKRKGAEADYPPALIAEAEDLAGALSEAGRDRLIRNVIAGLPGSGGGWGLEAFRSQLDRYADLTPEDMRENLLAFLDEILPVCEEYGIHLAYHPDDPPYPILGLPRFMSTRDDFAALFEARPNPLNGMTFCTGSLGVRPDNDLPEMARAFGSRIHFAHLRNVRREAEHIPASFFEDDHLAGSTDMVAVVRAILEEERRRGADALAIPMRPDHGHALLTDIGSAANPGYTAVGRLKGLAELRGVMAALNAST